MHSCFRMYSCGQWAYVLWVSRCRVVFGPPIKWSGRTNKSIRPDHNILFEMIPLKLKIDTKHRLLMLNTRNVDEYFQNTPADLRHISSKAPLGPPTTDLKS